MAVIETVDKNEVLEKMQRPHPPQIVNVLEPDSYRLGIIKGSLKIPLSKLESRADELDKSREVITYCAGSSCTASRKAAEKSLEWRSRMA